MSEKPKSRKYSYIALIVALIAFIAAILLGITRGLVAMQMFTVASVENLNQYILISIGIGILGIAIYAIIEPDRVRRFFTGRQARYGSNALITSLAIVGVLIVGNLLAFENPQTLADLTEDNVNTLSPELLSAIQNLPENMTATGFFSQSSTETAEQLLSNIKANSNGKFDYRFINPDLDPQAAINAGVTGDGKILLQMGDHSAIVAFANESEILKGLLQLLNPESSAIYFLSGHGERDTEQSGESSMTRAVSTLENKNYTVNTLNLIVDNEIPEDARVIVIAGPLQPISENELNLLKEFLDNGGSLIVMEDPIPLTEFGEETDPLADLLLNEWGISLNNDIVIDLNSPQPTTAAAAYYDAAHPITVNMNNLVSIYPFTRSIGMADPIEGITLTSLVQTNERSWGETNFETLSEDGQVELNEGEMIGPLTLALAGENPATNGRLVVFGTSQFALDQIFDAYGNGDMFVNSVDWAAEQENLTTITPRDTTERTFIPPSQLYSVVILLTSIFVIPGLVLVGGVSTWLTRRRQG